MKLLTEQYDDDQVLLIETSTDSKGVTYIEGPFAMAEKVNRNKRKYPKSLMEMAVDRYIKDYINERRALGELNHPPGRPFADPAVAALITESLSWQGNNVNGKARVIDSPMGRQIKALMEAGFRMGVSTRGLGEVKQLREHSLVSNYVLNAVDAVDRPSGQECYVDAVNESYLNEWVEENGVWVQKKAFNESVFLNNLDRMIETLKAQRKNSQA